MGRKPILFLWEGINTNKSVTLAYLQCCTILDLCQLISMELIALPFAFLLWFLAYEAKPIRKDEIGLIWEEENVLKRLKITNIFNENN